VRTRGGAETFRSLLAAHLDDLRARRLSSSALRLATRVLPRLFTHLREDGIRDIRVVSEAHLVRFARGLAAAGLSPQSQATYLAAVKRFFTPFR
jgi:site-specific recombinase XerD